MGASTGVVIVVTVFVVIIVVVVVPATEPSAVIIVVVIVAAHSDQGRRKVIGIRHGSAYAAALAMRAALRLHRSEGRKPKRHCQGRRREKKGKSGSHGSVSLDLMLPICAPDLSGS